MTPAELVGVAKQARKDVFKALGAGEKPDRALWASNPAKLAADYQALVYEIVSRIAQYEASDRTGVIGVADRVAIAGR